jgi:hypothetical protein
MLDRILTGWSFQRAFYLIAGGGMVIMSIVDHQWPGVLIGGYFASMGLFAFGCASGNCYGGACKTDMNKESDVKTAEPFTKN